MPRRTLLLTGAAALALGAGATDAALSAAASHSASIAANRSGKLRFTKSRLVVAHGTVRIRFANASGIPHAVAVEGHGVDRDGKTITKGHTTLVLRGLKRGTYELYCPVDGHKAAGMKAKLVVR